MKIYTCIKNIDTEYVSIGISLTPFDNCCWESELTDSLPTRFKNIDSIRYVWKPYNVVIGQLGSFDEDKNFIPEKLGKDTVYKCTVYVDGDQAYTFFNNHKPDWMI